MRRGLVLVLLALAAVAAGAATASRDSGLPAWWRLRAHLADAQARVAAVESEIRALEEERRGFADSPLALERAIREELGLARPGELVVLWPSEAGTVAAQDAGGAAPANGSEAARAPRDRGRSQ